MNSLKNKQILSLINQPNKCLNLTNSQWSELIFILRENDLLARFYYFASEQNLIDKFPNKVQHHLRSAKIKADRQALQAIFEATELTKNLSSLNIKPIFLKGVAYTLRNSLPSKGRIYSDMDILVSKDKLKEVERKLTFFGWFSKAVDEYDDKYYRQWAHEIPPMQQASRGTVADIHHNLLPPISGKAPEIELFTKDLHTTSDGLCTLNKPAMVLHSIIHLFFNEEFTNGFRDLTDLHLMFIEETADSELWQNLLILSKKCNFTTELFYAVYYCEHIMGTQFPTFFKNEANQYRPKKFLFVLTNFIFSRVLLPYHPQYSDILVKMAHSLAAFRGHFLKMPIHILIYHSIHKAKDNALKVWKEKKSAPLP